MEVKGSRILVPFIGFDGNIGPNSGDFVLGNMRYLNRNVNPNINMDILISDIIESINPSEDYLDYIRLNFNRINEFPALFNLKIFSKDYYALTKGDLCRLCDIRVKDIPKSTDYLKIKVGELNNNDNLAVVCIGSKCQFISVYYKHFKPMYEWACKYCTIDK